MSYEDGGEVASAVVSCFMLLLTIINCWTCRIRCLALVPTKRPQLLANPQAGVPSACSCCPGIYSRCHIRVCGCKAGLERQLKQTTSSIYIAVLIVTCNVTVALVMLIPDGKSELAGKSMGLLIVMWLFGMYSRCCAPTSLHEMFHS
jgi:hypothetical protein